MDDVALADAKSHLSELVERAARGESVRITRHGKPVALIAGLNRTRKPIDLAGLRALTAAMPPQDEPARSWLRAMRDKAR